MVYDSLLDNIHVRVDYVLWKAGESIEADDDLCDPVVFCKALYIRKSLKSIVDLKDYENNS